MGDYVACPQCGFDSCDFLSSNIELLEEYGFGLPFEYECEMECPECGCQFTRVVRCTFEEMDIRIN